MRRACFHVSEAGPQPPVRRLRRRRREEGKGEVLRGRYINKIKTEEERKIISSVLYLSAHLYIWMSVTVVCRGGGEAV